jgi:hypothetical protein
MTLINENKVKFRTNLWKELKYLGISSFRNEF